MKKFIALTLSLLFLMSLVGSFSSFAQESTVPLPTGIYHSPKEFAPYQYQITGIDNKLITVNEVPYGSDLAVAKELGNTLDIQIKNDYIAFEGDNISTNALTVIYYGTLSDGSIVCDINGPYSYAAVNSFYVIGKYLYFIHSAEQVQIYKDHRFNTIYNGYVNGDITDSVLDEIAQVMHLAKFAEPVDEEYTLSSSETQAVTTQTATDISNETHVVFETTVEITTVVVSTPVAATDSAETTVAATKDSATVTEPTDSSAVQTGSSNPFAVAGIVAAVAAAGVLYTVNRRKTR